MRTDGTVIFFKCGGVQLCKPSMIDYDMPLTYCTVFTGCVEFKSVSIRALTCSSTMQTISGSLGTTMYTCCVK